ncbi:hypothetical protein D3C84_936400 [compost metagenome]
MRVGAIGQHRIGQAEQQPLSQAADEAQHHEIQRILRGRGKILGDHHQAGPQQGQHTHWETISRQRQPERAERQPKQFESNHASGGAFAELSVAHQVKHDFGGDEAPDIA